MLSSCSAGLSRLAVCPNHVGTALRCASSSSGPGGRSEAAFQRRRPPNQRPSPQAALESADVDGEQEMAAAVAAQSSPLLTASAKKINKSMLLFIERAERHEKFLEREQAEFELGKRHLANMMGLNHLTMTQQDIDEAIAFLFPSGLFNKAARPILKPPDELWPARKAAQFDSTGRPFHPLFYTRRPNFYQLTHVGGTNDVHSKYLKLEQYRRQQLADPTAMASTKTDPEWTTYLTRSAWMNKEPLERRLMEWITDEQYAQFCAAGDHLCAHPLSQMEQEFITDYRRSVSTLSGDISDTFRDALKYDEQGRQYMEATGKRKHTIAKVRVTSLGSGKIMINGKPLSNIRMPNNREQIVAPLLLLNRTLDFDITAETEWTKAEKQYAQPLQMQEWPHSYYGESALAGAVRFGISLALKPFISEEDNEKLRLAGYLTYDIRIKERKKPGRVKARKSYTYKRR